jgi:undecaprenyl diphosphate synthase
MVDVAVTAAEEALPLHVAVIMDGNGRWARARGLPRTLGHREGARAVRRTIEAAGDLGITHLTLFGFSSENWNRSPEEVGEIMSLIRFYLRREIAEMKRNNIRFRMIGDKTTLSDDLLSLVDHAERETESNSGLFLTLAISYGGRAEITDAVRRLAKDAVEGRIDPELIDEQAVRGRMFTGDLPDPDLLIRTSGEQRISNFLLWQCAYTEFFFTDVLWPDFDGAALADALGEFARRDRRYGRAVG